MLHAGFAGLLTMLHPHGGNGVREEGGGGAQAVEEETVITAEKIVCCNGVAVHASPFLSGLRLPAGFL